MLLKKQYSHNNKRQIWNNKLSFWVFHVLSSQILRKNLNKKISFSCVQGIFFQEFQSFYSPHLPLKKRGKGEMRYPPALLELSESRRSATPEKTLCVLCNKLLGNAVFKSLPAHTKLAKTTQSWTIPQHNFFTLKVHFCCPLELSLSQQAVPLGIIR